MNPGPGWCRFPDEVDAVALGHGCQSVRNSDPGPLPPEFGDRFVDLAFGLVIKR